MMRLFSLRIARALPGLLAVVAVVDIAIDAAYFLVSGAHVSEQIRISSSVPVHLPHGYSSRGQYLDTERGNQKCTVLRATNASCSSCARDEPGWQVFQQSMAGAGCSVFRLAVDANDARLAATSGIEELAYTSMDWIRDADIEAAPATLVFSQGHRLVWRRAGSTDQAMAVQALRAVARANAKSSETGPVPGGTSR